MFVYVYMYACLFGVYCMYICLCIFGVYCMYICLCIFGGHLCVCLADYSVVVFKKCTLLHPSC